MTDENVGVNDPFVSAGLELAAEAVGQNETGIASSIILGLISYQQDKMIGLLKQILERLDDGSSL